MSNRWFMDTEFDENGSTIKLISIALIHECGANYYACASDGWCPDDCDDWVRANVLPQLPPRGALRTATSPGWRTREQIREDVRGLLVSPHDMLNPDWEKPEIWGYFADYDWVVFCQLFGRMVGLPKGMPMYCRDLKQLMDERGIKKDQLPKQDEASAHDALADARWIREAWLAIKAMGVRRMGDAARKTDEPSDDRFDRLLVLLERLCQDLERGLAQGRDNAIRAARKAGPTTAEAEARVAERHRRWRERG